VARWSSAGDQVPSAVVTAVWGIGGLDLAAAALGARRG
jgi:hypothetical protein